MSRRSPGKISDEARIRLLREVEILVQHTPYKRLSEELGLTPKRISNFISRERRRREKASSEAG